MPFLLPRPLLGLCWGPASGHSRASCTRRPRPLQPPAGRGLGRCAAVIANLLLRVLVCGTQVLPQVSTVKSICLLMLLKFEKAVI